MPADRLWATVYKEDNEAFEIWKDLGMKEDHIVRLGKEDNFWEIGLGPCGPDSEIFFDRGEEYKCSDPDCKPGCDCDRFIEVWNHVFSQFSKEEDGSYRVYTYDRDAKTIRQVPESVKQKEASLDRKSVV